MEVNDREAERQRLRREIESAFATVERGAGLTLHEAKEFEGTDYCTAEERAAFRALDPWTRWQDIPDAALDDCEDQWCWDDEGFRFHLPAYMRWHLHRQQGLDTSRGSLLYFHFQPFGNTPKALKQWERSWDVFTPEQKRVIARFLEFVAASDGHHQQDAEMSLRSFWRKFSQPSTFKP